MRDAIHKEIEKLKTTDVTDAELADVQDPHPRRSAARPGRQPGARQLAGRVPDPLRRLASSSSSQLDEVDKVTKADIRRVANQVFVASNRTSAEIDTEPPAADAKKDGGAQ